MPHVFDRYKYNLILPFPTSSHRILKSISALPWHQSKKILERKRKKVRMKIKVEIIIFVYKPWDNNRIVSQRNGKKIWKFIFQIYFHDFSKLMYIFLVRFFCMCVFSFGFFFCFLDGFVYEFYPCKTERKAIISTTQSAS